MRRERNEVSTELLRDRQNLLQLDSKISELKLEHHTRETALSDKESALREYKMILDEAEAAYDKVRFLMMIVNNVTTDNEQRT